MPEQAEDDADTGEGEEVNALAAHLKEQLAKKTSPLARRESVSKLFDHSATFDSFRKGQDATTSAGHTIGSGPISPFDKRTKGEMGGGSVRSWSPESGMRAETALNSYLQEQGGVTIQESMASVYEGDEQQGDSGGEAQGGDSMAQDSDLGAGYDSWAMMQDEGAHTPGASTSITIDRNTVMKKRVLAGTVSTYKHKQELRSELERKAGLKFIAECRAAVRAREAVAKDAEEKVAIAQGHVDECEAKLAKLRAEADELHAQDRFGNREKVKALQARAGPLSDKLREAQAELAREAEIEYRARREYNNAEIELRKVEDLEPEMLLEEQQCNAEQRMVAHVRAEKEREAAFRLERAQQQRQQAAAEQRSKDAEKTQEAASVARAGRVAALKRVKQAKSELDTNQQSFEQIRVIERMQRASALLELKANTETVKDKIKAGNERNYKKIRAVQASRKAEKGDILAAGGNPYAVWRQQEQSQKSAQEQRAREERMKEMENKLLHQLMEEEARRKEKEERERERRAMMKEFQAQMGGSARQKQIVQYMKESTVGGAEVLDPTGRQPRIYPSKATLLVDWKFGLGRRPHPEGAAPGQDLPPGMPEGYAEGAEEAVENEGWRKTQKNRLIDQMQRKYPAEQFNETLAGSKYLDDSLRRSKLKGHGSQQQAEEDAALVALLDAHEAKRQAGGAEADAAEVYAVPEFKGIWDPEAAVEAGGGGSKYAASLSKLEQQYLKAAMDRKKAGYGWIEKQVVWGREFKGTAFVASEKGKDVTAIEFRDFVPGQVYKRKVTLTNASFAANTFKLLPLPDAVKDFFTIDYTHPSALSPGMTCDLHIIFEPKLNEDIVECIPLLCQTGPQDIPLRCLTKKVSVSTSTPEVELKVILGETITREIVLVNKGCLDCPFTIRQLLSAPRQECVTEDLALAEREGAYVGEEEREPTLAYAAEGVAVGYGTTRIPVTFTPVEAGPLQIPLHLVFKKDMSVPQSPDMFVMLRPEAYDVPIYVEEPVMDLRCCGYGVTYTQMLVVRNRGKVALKVMPQVPGQLRAYASFTPDMAYVQARTADGHDGHFAFRLRFQPAIKLLDSCREFVGEGPTGKLDTLSMPFRVGVPDQVLPVYFTLHVQLTATEVQVSQPELDFGEVAVSDAVMLRQTVTNLSELPCRIGFLKLPRGVSMKPALGVCSLLPYESRTLEISFQAYTDTDFSFPITLTTSHNRHIKIPCKATGVRAPLALSCSSFVLPACAAGDRVTHSFFATNEGTEARTLEVLVPKRSGLKLSPVVATVAPGKTIRFNLDFCPVATAPVDLGQPSLPISLPRKKAKADGEEDEEGEGGEGGGHRGGGGEATPRSAAGEGEEYELDADGNQIEEVDGEGNAILDDAGNPVMKKKPKPVDPNLLTPEEEELRAALLVESSESCEEGEAWSQHCTWQLPIFVKGGALMYAQVQTTTVQPLIVGTLNGSKLVSTVAKDGSETLPVIDFGKLPVGQERVIDIKLTNCIERIELAVDTDVTPVSLDPLGPFSVLKYPTRLKAGQSQTISLCFQPKKEAAFKERLVLGSGRNAVRYQMVGHGVSPIFTTSGLVDSSELNGEGRIDIGDVLQGGSIELPFTLSNNSPFEVSYSVDLANAGELNRSGVQAFDCIPMEALVEAGASKELKLTLSADVASLDFATVMRIVVPNQKEKMEWRVRGRCWQQALFVFDASLDALASPVNVNRFKDQVQQADSSISLEKTFPQVSAERDEPAIHDLMVGNCGSGAAGNFSFSNAADAAQLGFAVEPASGQVAAGTKTRVTVTYTPPAGGPLSVWNDFILQGTLSGGTPASSVTVEVRLRGFVPAKL